MTVGPTRWSKLEHETLVDSPISRTSFQQTNRLRAHKPTLDETGPHAMLPLKSGKALPAKPTRTRGGAD